MPNPHRGEVALDGTDHVLRFDYNQIVEVETAMGLNILAILSRLDGETPMSFGELRLMMWAALRGIDPKIKITDAGDIIGSVGVKPAVAAVVAALTASGLLGIGEEEAEPGEEKRRTG